MPDVIKITKSYVLNCRGDSLMQATQSLQLMIQEARRIENGVQMMKPIAGTDKTLGALRSIEVWSKQITETLMSMYNELAPEAFK